MSTPITIKDSKAFIQGLNEVVKYHQQAALAAEKLRDGITGRVFTQPLPSTPAQKAVTKRNSRIKKTT
jgi:hypothetical protein